MATNAPQTGYAPVNGLNMYYEIHGTGRPLVVLHGSFMTIELMGKLIPELAGSRQVIAVEFQGHGHTADVDRPITTSSWRTTRRPCCGTSGSATPTSTATAWGAGLRCRWRFGIRSWCASS